MHFHNIWQCKKNKHRQMEYFEVTPESVMEQNCTEEAQRNPMLWLRGIGPRWLQSQQGGRKTKSTERKAPVDSQGRSGWKKRGNPAVSEFRVECRIPEAEQETEAQTGRWKMREAR